MGGLGSIGDGGRELYRRRRRMGGLVCIVVEVGGWFVWEGGREGAGGE